MDKRFVFIAVGITGLIFVLLQSDFIQKKSQNILSDDIEDVHELINNISTTTTTRTTTTITTTTKPQLAIDLGKALFPAQGKVLPREKFYPREKVYPGKSLPRKKSTILIQSS